MRKICLIRAKQVKMILPFCSARVRHTWMFCLILGFSISESWTYWSKATEEPQNYQGLGAFVVQGGAERAGTVLPEDEKSWSQCVKVPDGVSQPQ